MRSEQHIRELQRFSKLAIAYTEGKASLTSREFEKGYQILEALVKDPRIVAIVRRNNIAVSRRKARSKSFYAGLHYAILLRIDTASIPNGKTRKGHKKLSHFVAEQWCCKAGSVKSYKSHYRRSIEGWIDEAIEGARTERGVLFFLNREVERLEKAAARARL